MTGKLLKGLVWFCGGLLISLTISCNDFDSFGSDLLDGDWINAKGIDTFKFSAGPAATDSVITFQNNATTLGSINFVNSSFPIGKMDDPMFGKVEAGFGTQLRIVATDNINFLTKDIDSVILSLRFDTSLFYGKYKEPMDFSIYPLTTAYNISNTYFSNNTLAFDASKKLGGLNSYLIGINETDSLPIKENDKDIRVFPQLRIPMDTSVLMPILRSFPDSVYSTLDSFSIAFNGIAVICEKGSGMLSVLPEHSDSRLTIYFHEVDSIQTKQEFNMGSLAVKTPYYKLDNQNTKSKECIDGVISGDSLLCLQGFEGRDIHITIPYDENWNGKFINFAVLQFYAADLPGDDPANYTLPDLLEIFDISSGSRVAIDDVAFGLNSPSNYKRVFGGYPVKTDINGSSVYSYKMNITRHFQKSLKAKKPMDLVISSLFKLESPARALFFGQGNSQFPAKLILTYSE